MAEILYPERQRCKKCRGKLDDVVLNGLFCSYKCAAHPAPTTDPAKANRQCAYPRPSDGVIVFKQRYRCESEISENTLARKDTQVYRCPVCLYLHTGTRVAHKIKDEMLVTSMSDLSQVLVKARGKATRTTVGKVAGVRPIRIKEIEEGAERIDPEALFALLKLYRISLSVGFRT